MQKDRLIAFALAACFAAGTAMVAAPGQSTQGTQPNQGLYTGTPADIIKVRVVNSGHEALPVSIQEAGSVLKVDVGNKVLLDPASVINTRVQSQTWEYKFITVHPGQADADARVLTAEGSQGWEATGAIVTSPGGPAILLKRQSQK